MPRINQYTDNTTIENDDKMLTYDTQGAATKLTAFSTIWNWIVSKLHALTSSSAALTPSTDRVLMDKNGTMTRVEPAAVAKYGIETYNGSTIAGSAQTVKSALDTLNNKTSPLNPAINPSAISIYGACSSILDYIKANVSNSQNGIMSIHLNGIDDAIPIMYVKTTSMVSCVCALHGNGKILFGMYNLSTNVKTMYQVSGTLLNA